MDTKGSRYARSELTRRRAALASEIIDLEGRLKHRKEMLVHVDATLRLLDPSIDPDTIPNKRPARRIKLFRQGELGRLIRDALRVNGGGPLSAGQIVDHILRAGGHGPEARKALAGRVRGNLAYLTRSNVVRKEGDGREARWHAA